MPPFIRFLDPRSLSVFHSMAEGMEEVQRDNDDIAMADALERLIETTGMAAKKVPEGAYPLNVILLPATLVAAAEAVLENCLDCSSGMTPDDPDAADYLFDGQVQITQ